MTQPPPTSSPDPVIPGTDTQTDPPSESVPPCPECESTEVTVDAVLGADPVVRYYRCGNCRHEWGVTEPTERIDDATGDPDPVAS